MLAAKVLICETRGAWAALVRRDLPGSATIAEMREFVELWPRLRDAPQAVVAIELCSGRGPELLASLRRLNCEFPRALAVVLAQRHLRDWEDICREAGAVAFVAGARNIGDLVEIVGCRAQAEWAADDEHLLLEDRILANLPWDN
jgi:hypothetical protein